MIDISHVSYQYEEAQKAAVNDISLHIERGSLTAILGRNGSGKSTLVKMINGLLLPTSGDVTVDGMNTKDEEKIWEIRKRAGMIFQNPDNQIVATTVWDDVGFGLENLGVPTEEMPGRITSALKQVGMEGYEQRAPHLLSGGQKQRVAIAGILAMQTEAILCDEATAMLDPRGRREVFDTIRRLNSEEGITVLWITHFMEEAVFCPRVIVVDEGSVISDSTPEELFGHPEELERLHLDAPMMARLSLRLRRKGIDFPMCLTAEDMAMEVARRCG